MGNIFVFQTEFIFLLISSSVWFQYLLRTNVRFLASSHMVTYPRARLIGFMTTKLILMLKNSTHSWKYIESHSRGEFGGWKWDWDWVWGKDIVAAWPRWACFAYRGEILSLPGNVLARCCPDLARCKPRLTYNSVRETAQSGCKKYGAQTHMWQENIKSKECSWTEDTECRSRQGHTYVWKLMPPSPSLCYMVNGYVYTYRLNFAQNWSRFQFSNLPIPN